MDLAVCLFVYSVSSAHSAPAAGSASSAPVPGGCPRCGKRVYEAEKKVAVGKVRISNNTHSRSSQRIFCNCFSLHSSLVSLPFVPLLHQTRLIMFYRVHCNRDESILGVPWDSRKNGNC